MHGHNSVHAGTGRSVTDDCQCGRRRRSIYTTCMCPSMCAHICYPNSEGDCMQSGRRERERSHLSGLSGTLVARRLARYQGTKPCMILILPSMSVMSRAATTRPRSHEERSYVRVADGARAWPSEREGAGRIPSSRRRRYDATVASSPARVLSMQAGRIAGRATGVATTCAGGRSTNVRPAGLATSFVTCRCTHMDNVTLVNITAGVD